MRWKLQNDVFILQKVVFNLYFLWTKTLYIFIMFCILKSCLCRTTLSSVTFARNYRRLAVCPLRGRNKLRHYCMCSIMQEAETNNVRNSDAACCYMLLCFIKSGILDLCPCTFLHFLSLSFLSSRLATVEIHSFFFFVLFFICSPAAPTSPPYASLVSWNQNVSYLTPDQTKVKLK